MLPAGYERSNRNEDEVQLDATSIEAIARRVVELLGRDAVQQQSLVTAAEVAKRFGVSRSWVYENADGARGAVRLGTGSKARLRFDPSLVERALQVRRPLGARAKHSAREPWVAEKRTSSRSAAPRDRRSRQVTMAKGRPTTGHLRRHNAAMDSQPSRYASVRTGTGTRFALAMSSMDGAKSAHELNLRT